MAKGGTSELIPALPPKREKSPIARHALQKPKKMVDLTWDGDVLVACMQAGPWHGEDCENVLSPQLLAELDAAVDEVCRSGGGSLVITSKGKWFCNGLNMKLMDHAHGHCADRYIDGFYKFLGRLVCCPCPVIAGINGHAFAGGMLLAMACDFRIMSEEKGLMCMPEIDMQGEVSPGRFTAADRQMLTVLQNKLPPLLVRDLFLKGPRLTASEALLRGIVDNTLAPEQVHSGAISFGQRWANKPRGSFAVLKRELSRSAVEILDPEGDLWWWEPLPARPCERKSRL